MAGSAQQGVLPTGVPGVLQFEADTRDYSHHIVESADGRKLVKVGVAGAAPAEWLMRTTRFAVRTRGAWVCKTQPFTPDSPAHERCVIDCDGEMRRERLQPPTIPARKRRAGSLCAASDTDRHALRLVQTVAVQRTVARWMFVPLSETIEGLRKRLAGVAEDEVHKWIAAFLDMDYMLHSSKLFRETHVRFYRRKNVRSAAALLMQLSGVLRHHMVVVSREDDEFMRATKIQIQRIVNPTRIRMNNRLMSSHTHVMGLIGALCGLTPEDVGSCSVVCVAEGRVGCELPELRDEGWLQAGLFMVEWISPDPPELQRRQVQQNDPGRFADAKPLFGALPARVAVPRTQLHPGVLVAVDLDKWDYEQGQCGLPPFPAHSRVPAHPAMPTARTIYSALGLTNENKSGRASFRVE